MAVLTKVKIFPTIIIVGIIVAFLYLNNHDPENNIKNDLKDEKDVELLLKVTFPNNRSNPVTITVTVSSPVPEYSNNDNASPWNYTTRANIGDRVILTVLQTQSGRAECNIFRNGGQVANNYMVGPGNIACQYLVIS